jgi:hypothetical protein
VLLHPWMAVLGSLVVPLGLVGPVVLGPWLQGPWWCLAPLASWHRGGASDRPGVDERLDLHCPVRPLVVERWSAHLLCWQRGLALLLSVAQPRVAKVGLYRRVFGAGGCSRAKALLEADDGNACGCRFLLGGIVMALPVLPHLERRGKPLIRLARSDNSGTTVSSSPWRRCLGRWWSPRRGTMECIFAAALSEGFRGAMYAVGGSS